MKKKLMSYAAAVAAVFLFGSARAAESPRLFGPYITISTAMPGHAEAVAIGDVNNDGREDVVMATSFYGYQLHVFLQLTSGALAAPISYPTRGTSSKSVDIGDMNNDGRLDVVVGNSQDSLEIFLQDAFGHLAPSIVHPTVHSTIIEIADLNGDGLSDVAGIGRESEVVAVFLQSLGGTLQAGVTYRMPYSRWDSLALGDLNSDGLIDIVVKKVPVYESINFAVLTQNPSGGFLPAALYGTFNRTATSNVAIGDINGDGAKDVFMTHDGVQSKSRISVFYQNTSGTLDRAVSFDSLDMFSESAKAADLNSDGHDDIVVRHPTGLGVYLRRSDGGFTSEFYDAYLSPADGPSLALGDISGDGRVDAVLVGAQGGVRGLTTLINVTTSVPNVPTPDVFLEDNMENGTGLWTISGVDGQGGPALWNLSNHRYASTSTAFYYGRAATRTYNTGARNQGAITSRPISLAGATGTQLRFSHHLRTEGQSPYDTARVEVSSDGGLRWDVVYTSALPTPGLGLERKVIDLGRYDGGTIQLRFSFDTVDSVYNNFEGWVIDDVIVTAKRPR